MKAGNKQGFSLVELSIALGLIAILLGVVSAGSGMMARTRLQREGQAIDNLRLAAQNYLSASSLTYAGISVDVLKTSGYLPATFEPLASNSYGGDYLVAAAADPTRVDVVLTNVPEEAATELVLGFRGKASETSYETSHRTLTMTF